MQAVGGPVCIPKLGLHLLPASIAAVVLKWADFKEEAELGPTLPGSVPL